MVKINSGSEPLFLQLFHQTQKVIMATKKYLLHSFHHFLIGGILVLKGFTKFDHHPLLGSLIILFGIIILLYFFYTILKKTESRKMNIAIHIFEALVAIFTAYIFWDEGKRYLQYASLLAAIGFFIAAYIHIKRKK